MQPFLFFFGFNIKAGLFDGFHDHFYRHLIAFYGEGFFRVGNVDLPLFYFFDIVEEARDGADTVIAVDIGLELELLFHGANGIA